MLFPSSTLLIVSHFFWIIFVVNPVLLCPVPYESCSLWMFPSVSCSSWITFCALFIWILFLLCSVPHKFSFFMPCSCESCSFLFPTMCESCSFYALLLVNHVPFCSLLCVNHVPSMPCSLQILFSSFCDMFFGSSCISWFIEFLLCSVPPCVVFLESCSLCVMILESYCSSLCVLSLGWIRT